jgi:hypothetical protein
MVSSVPPVARATPTPSTDEAATYTMYSRGRVNVTQVAPIAETEANASKVPDARAGRPNARQGAGGVTVCQDQVAVGRIMESRFKGHPALVEDWPFHPLFRYVTDQTARGADARACDADGLDRIRQLLFG